MNADRPKDYYQRRIESPEYLASRGKKARLIAEICKDRLESAEKVVDLGCGNGLILRALETRSSRKIFGVEKERERLKTKEGIVIADLASLPLVASSIDFAICNHVFEHIADKRKCLREMRDILKEGGIIYFTVGNKYQPIEPHYRLPFLSWLPRALADFYLRMTGRGREYSGIEYTSYWKLCRMVDEAGFTVEDITMRVLATRRERLQSSFMRALAWCMAGLPVAFSGFILKLFSPHWFFLFTPRTGTE